MFSYMPLLGAMAPDLEQSAAPASGGLLARFLNRLAPQQGLTDQDRRALLGQGLLSFASGMQSQSGPGAFGAGLANGINQGLLSIRQGGADFEDRQYRQAIMDRMTANSGRELRLQDIRGRVQNSDGSINAQAFKEWQIEDPKGAGEWMQAVNPTRKNPGAPVYFPNADGTTEDPYIWDDQQGGYVPAGHFVSHGLLGDVSQYMPPTIGAFNQQGTPVAASATNVDPVNDFGKLIGDFPGVQVSSLYRTPQHNAAVGGAENSYHTRGQGMDVVVPGPMQADFINRGHSMGYDVLNEGDHLHVEPSRGVTATSAFSPGQSVSAPQADGMRTSANVFGRRTIKAKETEGAYRRLTPQETSDYGFPEGTVAQVGPNGKVDVLNKPDARTGTPGVQPLSAGEAAKVRTQFKETKDALNMFLAFDKALDEVPSGPGLLLDGVSKGRLGTAYNNARAALRTLYNTGVLQPGELPMLESALRDPTSFQAMMDPRTRPQIQGQLDELYRTVQRSFDNQVESYPQLFNQEIYQQRKGAGGSAPRVGQVQDGYRFNGGDASDPNSWEKL